MGLTALLARAESPDQGLNRLFSIEVVETMFATESRVPIVRVLGGRLQLDGFTSAYHMENLQLGPSGLGHPGVTVPRSAWVYGISLRFRLGRDAQAEPRGNGWRRLAWMVGAGRDGRIWERTPQLAASPND
jgi:hypothetical protein